MRNNLMGEGKISVLLFKFSVPAIVGMMVNALYNMVDRIFIGNAPILGPDGLAGITLAFPLMLLMLALGVLSGIGGATLFSLYLGEGKPEESKKVLAQAFFMLISTAFIYMVFGQVFLDQVLALLGGESAILPYAKSYLRVILMGTVFQVTSMGLNNFIRADGNPKMAMFTMFIGAGLNIVLDALFIFGFGMGMTGAALATVLAQGVSFTWVLSYFLGSKARISLDLKGFRPQREIALAIVALGLPGFLLQLASSLLNSVLNKSLLFYGGDLAVSAMGAVNSLQTFFIMPIIGLNQGALPLISFNFGARQITRVKETVKLAILAASAIAIISFLLTRFFPVQLVSLFNRDPALLILGRKAIQTWFLGMPLVGFQIIAAHFFQAIGRPKSAMLLTLSRQVLFLIPSVLLLPRFWGLDGLLFAAPLADFFATLITGLWFYLSIRKLSEAPLT